MDAKSGLQTVDEYVGKMRNRVDYLAQSEARMLNKIDRMHEIMAKREQVILRKWQDQVQMQENLQKKDLEHAVKTSKIRDSYQGR